MVTALPGLVREAQDEVGHCQQDQGHTRGARGGRQDVIVYKMTETLGLFITVIKSMYIHYIFESPLICVQHD